MWKILQINNEQIWVKKYFTYIFGSNYKSCCNEKNVFRVCAAIRSWSERDKVSLITTYKVFNSMKRITADTEFDYNIQFKISWFLEECLKHCLLVYDHSYQCTHHTTEYIIMNVLWINKLNSDGRIGYY